ncbi:MAG: antibiotic biosynthesis monooxygenase [Bacteroidetes bacterium]|nr:MAG: antibiotic biosynthesis monooxygenase [Bacteroidota bacterium]
MPLIRIVRMTFQSDKIEAFRQNFDENKQKIRASVGCQHLELWQDLHQPNVFCTYSIWNSEEDLNNYRSSALFETVWATTKAWFSDKPQAFSVQKQESV